MVNFHVKLKVYEIDAFTTTYRAEGQQVGDKKIYLPLTRRLIPITAKIKQVIIYLRNARILLENLIGIGNRHYFGRQTGISTSRAPAYLGYFARYLHFELAYNQY